jgi:hypothetical protein
MQQDNQWRDGTSSRDYDRTLIIHDQKLHARAEVFSGHAAISMGRLEIMLSTTEDCSYYTPAVSLPPCTDACSREA